MPTYDEIFHSRVLDQRARLSFWYENAGGKNPIMTHIPFYENPKITESQSANYAEYTPIARAGTLYAYTGSTSRKIKVDLTFTLDHLAMHAMGIQRFMRVYTHDSTESRKAEWFGGKSKNSKNKPNSLSEAVEKQYWAIRYPDAGDKKGWMFNDVKQAWIYSEGLSNISKEENLASEILSGKNTQSAGMDRVIDTLLFFMALLRTSVVNNVADPKYGPPLIRLDWGTMYQSVPCLCKSYNINWVEEAGYDLPTLTPKRLKISLKLEEVRVGNLEEYATGEHIKRDNLTGWESAIAEGIHTTDPLPQHGYWKNGNIETGLQ